MRVLYLYQYFVARKGHGMTRAYEFARRLICKGHEVTVVTLPGYLPEEYQQFKKTTLIDIEGVPTIIIPVAYSNYMGFSRRILAFVQFAILASWVCIRTPADVIYASSGPLTIAIPAIIGKLFQRIPMVFEVRDLWPELPIAIGAIQNPLLKWLAKNLEWVAYHSSRHVVALSPGMADGVEKRGVPKNRITTIPNSCDIDLFDVPTEAGLPIRKKLGLDPAQPLVVYTGTFGLMNNVIYMVDIAHEMQKLKSDCRFLLIGSGAKFEETIDYAKQRNLLDKTVFIWKPLPKVEVPAVLSAATVTSSLFLPVREMWHNSANKFFDSLAAGRPIAINYGGWQAELLKETGAGIQIAADDPRQAAHQLADFLNDPDRLALAGAAAKELAHTRFHRDKMADKLEAVLKQVTGQ